MENTRLLYDQYKVEKENTHEGVQTDVIKRIENYPLLWNCVPNLLGFK